MVAAASAKKLFSSPVYSVLRKSLLTASYAVVLEQIGLVLFLAFAEIAAFPFWVLEFLATTEAGVSVFLGV
jgi:hypothetical protein